MNLCGVPESLETSDGSKVLPMSQTRPPPSPLIVSIAPPEFQTPRSGKGESLGMTATPSPALLNPLSHEFWNDSSSARAPILCPRLETAPKISEPLIQRLLSGFRVKIHDGSFANAGRVVEIRLSEDRSMLHVIDDTMTEHSDDEEAKNRSDASLVTQTLYNILIDDIVRVDDSGEGFLPESCNDVDPLKCFSIITNTTYDGCYQFEFECIALKQREAIVSALRTLSDKKEKSLRMRRKSLPSFRSHSSAQVLPGELDELDLSVPEAMISPMQRTCIYPGAGAMEEGTELALNPAHLPRRKSLPPDSFSFSEVVSAQESLEASSSLFAASFQEVLDKWCADDGCAVDLTEVSESLQCIFYILGSQPVVELSDDGNYVRSDSLDMQAASMCVTDFLDTSASFFADLPSPISSDEKQSPECRSKRLRNRVCVSNAQAYRWRKLETEMTFGSVVEKEFIANLVTKSFDDLDITAARAASSQRVASGNFTDTSGYGLFELFPAGLWGTDTDNLFPEREDCDYYDSDSECSRTVSGRKGLRYAHTAQLGGKKTAIDTKKSSRLTFSVPRDLGFRFDDEYATEIIDIMKSEQLSLLWHPTPSQALPSRAPLSVTAWIERGTYLLSQAFVQPKLMWRPAHEMKLGSNRPSLATEAPERLDLLDIARIQDAPNIDRTQFPFVNKRHCFLIETQSEIYLFEAESIQDKKRIVFGLKLTVSRLASLIMIRDTKAVEEFFEPAQVPGQAPKFIM